MKVRLHESVFKNSSNRTGVIQGSNNCITLPSSGGCQKVHLSAQRTAVDFENWKLFSYTTRLLHVDVSHKCVYAGRYRQKKHQFLTRGTLLYFGSIAHAHKGVRSASMFCFLHSEMSVMS